MSRKEDRRRAIGDLLQSAHAALHLLLNLEDAISNRGVAAECRRVADRLSHAIEGAAKANRRALARKEAAK
jgi:hypothetical protein